MSQIDALFTKALPASEVLRRFCDVAKTALSEEQVKVTLSTNIPGLRLELQHPASDVRENKALKAFLHQTTNRDHLLCTTASLAPSKEPTAQIQYSTDDGVVAKIKIQSSEKPERLLPFLTAIEEHFNVTSYVDLIRNSTPVIDQNAIAMRERSVGDLQEAVKKLAEFMSNLAQRETESRQRLQVELEKSYQERQEKLEKGYLDRQSSLDARKAAQDEEIENARKKLLDREAEFDLRESRGVRRALLQDIKTVLKEAETQQLSLNTQSKRWWIHGFTWVLIMCSGVAGALYIRKLLSLPQGDWHILIPLAATFATFVTTLVYYLKWNDRWFREHADAEFAAKRYKADILRASWLAELISEWAKESKGELPADIVTAYTRNLFSDIGTSRVSEHPLDSLTGMIKRATEVEIGKGAFSIRSAKPDSKEMT